MNAATLCSATPTFAWAIAKIWVDVERPPPTVDRLKVASHLAVGVAEIRQRLESHVISKRLLRAYPCKARASLMQVRTLLLKGCYVSVVAGRDLEQREFCIAQVVARIEGLAVK
jgi:hypothetical protein